MPVRAPVGSPALSNSSASSSPLAPDPDALVLFLADVHLRSGHHSHLYRQTERGTRSHYFIKHGRETFSRKLYKAQPSVPGTPNVRRGGISVEGGRR